MSDVLHLWDSCSVPEASWELNYYTKISVFDLKYISFFFLFKSNNQLIYVLVDQLLHNVPLSAVLQLNRGSLPRRKTARTQNLHSPLKKGSHKQTSKEYLFSSKNLLAIRRTIQLHRYIFSIPHIQSANKSNDYKANKVAAIYIEMYVQWL